MHTAAVAFVTMLTAHLVGDFVFQTEWMVERKRRIWVLILHVAVVAALSGLLLGVFHWQILLAIFLTHFALDAIKVYWFPDSIASLAGDQFAHLAVLLALACYFPSVAADGWTAGMRPDASKWYPAVLTVISGVVLCVPAGGIVIARLTRPLAREIWTDDIAGLTKGGQYIGWLERLLVMQFLLIDQPNGIGFLIAAKSVLRFGEIKDRSQRKVAEYIIIGTFLSFGWALWISWLTQKALRYWTG